VSGIGSINGDIFDDVIIGAKDSSPKGRAKAGSAFVFYGREETNSSYDLSSLSQDGTGFTVIGENAGDELGLSVSRAGDFNCDGYDDVVVGAPAQFTNSGRAFLLYGGKIIPPEIDVGTDVIGDNGFVINGIEFRDLVGSSGTFAGDINGDGYPDVILGASNAPSGNATARGEGEVYVVYGQGKRHKKKCKTRN